MNKNTNHDLLALLGMKRRTSKEQALEIKSIALSMLAEANGSVAPERQVTPKSVNEVLWRSLNASRGLAYSARRDVALQELADFIDAAQGDLSLAEVSPHADLFPVSHPFSARQHSLTASGLIHARAQWLLADVSVTDELRPLLASALSAPFGSLESQYAINRLNSTVDGAEILQGLVAAGSMSGGNSWAARSMRAKLQRRDRKGRFAYMGGGVSVLVRLPDGSVQRLTGRIVGMQEGGTTYDFETPDGTIYRIPADKGEGLLAVLPAKPGSNGYSGIAADIGLEDEKDVINESDLVRLEAPAGWFKRGEEQVDPVSGEKFQSYMHDSGEYSVGKLTAADGSSRFAIRDEKDVDKGKILAEVDSWASVTDALDANTSMAEKSEVKARLAGEGLKALPKDDLEEMVKGAIPAPAAPVSARPKVAGKFEGETSPDGKWKWFGGDPNGTMVMVDGKLVHKNPERAPGWRTPEQYAKIEEFILNKPGFEPIKFGEQGASAVTGEKVMSDRMQKLQDLAKSRGQFPVARQAGQSSKDSDVTAVARQEYSDVYDSLKAENSDIASKYPTFEDFWAKVLEFSADNTTKSPNKLEDIPEEMKAINEAYAKKILGIDPDGMITFYRNASGNYPSQEAAARGYVSLDKDMAWDYNSDSGSTSPNAGRYTVSAKPSEVYGMLGYSKNEDEFAVAVGDGVVNQEGRVTRVGDLEVAQFAPWLANANAAVGRNGGSSPHRSFALAGNLQLRAVDNPVSQATYDEFLSANGVTREDFAAKVDELFGAGTYDAIKAKRTAPKYQQLQGMFVDAGDGKVGLDVSKFSDGALAPWGYGDSTDVGSLANDRVDATLKFLAAVQDLTGSNFMKVRKEGEPVYVADAPAAPAAPAKLKPDASIIESTRLYGGFTVRPNGEVPTDGVVVAVRDTNVHFDPQEFFSGAANDKIVDFLIANADRLDKPNGEFYIGTWHDLKNNEVVLDVAERFTDREAAIQAGRDRNQQAVFDLATFEEIPTGGTGDREKQAGSGVDSTAEGQENIGDDPRGTIKFSEFSREGSEGQLEDPYADEPYPPTAEQAAIIDAMVEGKDVVVKAFAGTGKTSTLLLAGRRLAKEFPNKKILYVVFNKKNQVEAEDRFRGTNVEPRTMDSLSVAGVKSANANLHSRLGAGDAIFNLKDAALRVGISPYSHSVNGEKVAVPAEDVYQIARAAVTKFAVSADSKVNLSHFDTDSVARALSLPTESFTSDMIPAEFFDAANKIWDNISDPNADIKNNIKVEYSDLMKSWALSNPDFSNFNGGYELVMVDEAQDLNPVFTNIMKQNKGKVQEVYVGDQNQAIYGFRGGIDEMDNVDVDVRLPITESFRFGAEVADIGNRFLSLIGERLRMKGSGFQGAEILTAQADPKTTPMDIIENPDVVLARTNAGIIEAALDMIAQGKVVGVSKNVKEELDQLFQTAMYMQGIFKTKPFKGLHQDIAKYGSWKDFQERANPDSPKYDRGAGYLSGIIKKIDSDFINNLQIVREPGDQDALVNVTAENAAIGASTTLASGIKTKFGLADITSRILDDGSIAILGATTDIKDGLKALGFSFDLQAARALDKNGNPAVYKQNSKPGAKKVFKPGDPKWEAGYILKVEDDAKRLSKLNSAASVAVGLVPDELLEVMPPVDVQVSTIHTAKGLEWDRVQIWSDFPWITDVKQVTDGDLISPTELMTSYVAATRAKKALGLGGLSWVMNITDPNGGVAPEPVSPEAQALADANEDLEILPPISQGTSALDVVTDADADPKIVGSDAPTSGFAVPINNVPNTILSDENIGNGSGDDEVVSNIIDSAKLIDGANSPTVAITRDPVSGKNVVSIVDIVEDKDTAVTEGNKFNVAPIDVTTGKPVIESKDEDGKESIVETTPQEGVGNVPGGTSEVRPTGAGRVPSVTEPVVPATPKRDHSSEIGTIPSDKTDAVIKGAIVDGLKTLVRTLPTGKKMTVYQSDGSDGRTAGQWYPLSALKNSPSNISKNAMARQENVDFNDDDLLDFLADLNNGAADNIEFEVLDSSDERALEFISEGTIAERAPEVTPASPAAGDIIDEASRLADSNAGGVGKLFARAADYIENGVEPEDESAAAMAQRLERVLGFADEEPELAGEKNTIQGIIDAIRGRMRGEISSRERAATPAAPAFNAPEGAYVPEAGEYDVVGRTDEGSSDFTDDPKSLATKFTKSELIAALREGLLGREFQPDEAKLKLPNPPKEPSIPVEPEAPSMDDPDYEKELAKYEKDIAKYDKNRSKYEQQQADYDNAVAQYEAEVEAIRKASVIKNANGYGLLPFNDGSENVAVEAIRDALAEQGENSDAIIQSIYDGAFPEADSSVEDAAPSAPSAPSGSDKKNNVPEDVFNKKFQSVKSLLDYFDNNSSSMPNFIEDLILYRSTQHRKTAKDSTARSQTPIMFNDLEFNQIAEHFGVTPEDVAKTFFDAIDASNGENVVDTMSRTMSKIVPSAPAATEKVISSGKSPLDYIDAVRTQFKDKDFYLTSASEDKLTILHRPTRTKLEIVKDWIGKSEQFAAQISNDSKDKNKPRGSSVDLTSLENAISLGVQKFESAVAKAVKNDVDGDAWREFLQYTKESNKSPIINSTQGGSVPDADEDIADIIETVTTDGETVSESDAKDIASNADAIDLPPLLEGLTDDEKVQYRLTGDYTQFLPKNIEVSMPAGFTSVSPIPYTSNGTYFVDSLTHPRAVEFKEPIGATDNPVVLASVFPESSLRGALFTSLDVDNASGIAGVARMTLLNEDNEVKFFNVPNTAVRDALQLQGVDTNKLLSDFSKSMSKISEEDALDKTAIKVAKEAFPWLSPSEVKKMLKGLLTLDQVAALGEERGHVPYKAKGRGSKSKVESQNQEDENNPTPPTPTVANAPGIVKQAIATKDLKAGDVTTDGFVIESVGTEILSGKGKKKVEVLGYFPGHPTQSKPWNFDTKIEVFRGIPANQMPLKGNLPELHKPKVEDFEGGYDSPEFKMAYAKWRGEWRAAIARWANSNAPDEFTGAFDYNTDPHSVSVFGQDVRPGDVSFDPAHGHFVVTRVFSDADTKEGKISVEGYYPGHQIQRKEWNRRNEKSPIRVYRNVTLPESGDLPPIHQPHTVDENGVWRPDFADKEGMAKYRSDISKAASSWADKPASAPYITEMDESDAGIVEPSKPWSPRNPDPHFLGSAIDLARESGGDPAVLREKIMKDSIIFDTETTGLDHDSDRPWSIGAVKIKDGVIVDRFMEYVNPGKTVNNIPSDLRAKWFTPDGAPISDEFLGEQMSKEEIARKWVEWAGEDALLIAHNSQFDRRMMEELFKDAGLEFKFGGFIDSQGIAKAVHDDMPSAERPKDPKNGRYSNSLGVLAPFYGVSADDAKGWHNADVDSEMTFTMLNGVLDEFVNRGFGKDTIFDTDGMMTKWEEQNANYYDTLLPNYKRSMAEYEDKMRNIAAIRAVKELMNGGKTSAADLLDEVEKTIKSTLPADVDVDSRLFPNNRMKIMTPEWVLDPENTSPVNAGIGSAFVSDLNVGDFIFDSKNNLQQIVAIENYDENVPFKSKPVKLTRLNNISGSYSYTDDDGVEYEIFNPSKEFGGVSEWIVKPDNGTTDYQVFKNLKEVREYFESTRNPDGTRLESRVRITQVDLNTGEVIKTEGLKPNKQINSDLALRAKRIGDLEPVEPGRGDTVSDDDKNTVGVNEDAPTNVPLVVNYPENPETGLMERITVSKNPDGTSNVLVELVDGEGEVFGSKEFESNQGLGDMLVEARDAAAAMNSEIIDAINDFGSDADEPDVDEESKAAKVAQRSIAASDVIVDKDGTSNVFEVFKREGDPETTNGLFEVITYSREEGGSWDSDPADTVTFDTEAEAKEYYDQIVDYATKRGTIAPDRVQDGDVEDTTEVTPTPVTPTPTSLDAPLGYTNKGEPRKRKTGGGRPKGAKNKKNRDIDAETPISKFRRKVRRAIFKSNHNMFLDASGVPVNEGDTIRPVHIDKFRVYVKTGAPKNNLRGFGIFDEAVVIQRHPLVERSRRDNVTGEMVDVAYEDAVTVQFPDGSTGLYFLSQFVNQNPDAVESPNNSVPALRDSDVPPQLVMMNDQNWKKFAKVFAEMGVEFDPSRTDGYVARGLDEEYAIERYTADDGSVRYKVTQRRESINGMRDIDVIFSSEDVQDATNWFVTAVHNNKYGTNYSFEDTNLGANPEFGLNVKPDEYGNYDYVRDRSKTRTGIRPEDGKGPNAPRVTPEGQFPTGVEPTETIETTGTPEVLRDGEFVSLEDVVEEPSTGSRFKVVTSQTPEGDFETSFVKVRADGSEIGRAVARKSADYEKATASHAAAVSMVNNSLVSDMFDFPEDDGGDDGDGGNGGGGGTPPLGDAPNGGGALSLREKFKAAQDEITALSDAGAAPTEKSSWGGDMVEIPFTDPATGETKSATIVKVAGRPMALVDVNGVKIPFYVSTGSGGKEIYGLPKNVWYPILGIEPESGWFNKGDPNMIKENYNIPELKSVNDWLNSNFSDVTPFSDLPEVDITSEEFLNFINQDLSPTKNNFDAFLSNLKNVADKVISGRGNLNGEIFDENTRQNIADEGFRELTPSEYEQLMIDASFGQNYDLAEINAEYLRSTIFEYKGLVVHFPKSFSMSPVNPIREGAIEEALSALKQLADEDSLSDLKFKVKGKSIVPVYFKNKDFLSEEMGRDASAVSGLAGQYIDHSDPDNTVWGDIDTLVFNSDILTETPRDTTAEGFVLSARKQWFGSYAYRISKLTGVIRHEWGHLKDPMSEKDSNRLAVLAAVAKSSRVAGVRFPQYGIEGAYRANTAYTLGEATASFAGAELFAEAFAAAKENPKNPFAQWVAQQLDDMGYGDVFGIRPQSRPATKNAVGRSVVTVHSTDDEGNVSVSTSPAFKQDFKSASSIVSLASATRELTPGEFTQITTADAARIFVGKRDALVDRDMKKKGKKNDKKYREMALGVFDKKLKAMAEGIVSADSDVYSDGNVTITFPRTPPRGSGVNLMEYKSRVRSIVNTAKELSERFPSDVPVHINFTDLSSYGASRNGQSMPSVGVIEVSIDLFGKTYTPSAARKGWFASAKYRQDPAIGTLIHEWGHMIDPTNAGQRQRIFEALSDFAQGETNTPQYALSDGHGGRYTGEAFAEAFVKAFTEPNDITPFTRFVSDMLGEMGFGDFFQIGDRSPSEIEYDSDLDSILDNLDFDNPEDSYAEIDPDNSARIVESALAGSADGKNAFELDAPASVPVVDDKDFNEAMAKYDNLRADFDALMAATGKYDYDQSLSPEANNIRGRFGYHLRQARIYLEPKSFNAIKAQNSLSLAFAAVRDYEQEDLADMSPLYNDSIVDPAEVFEYEAVLDSLVSLTGVDVDLDRYALHGRTNKVFDEIEPLLDKMSTGLSTHQKSIDLYNSMENITKLIANGKIFQASIAARKLEDEIYSKKLLNTTDPEHMQAANKISNMANMIEEYVLANNVTESTYADPPETPSSMLPADFDVLEVRESRIAAGTNSTTMPQYVIDSTSVMSDNTREEIENFHKSRSPQPLGLLSSDARRELSAFIKEEFYNNAGLGLDAGEARSLYALSLALNEERLAYEPNATSLGSADFFRGINPDDLELATDSVTGNSWENPNDFVRFSVNGQYTGFSVKKSGLGGGSADTNVTYIIKNNSTGEMFIYKRELNREARDAEVATSELMRGMGIIGASYVAPHYSDETVLVSTFAGSNMDIDPASAISSGSYMYPNASSDKEVNELTKDALLAYGNFQQNMSVGILDGVINNLDRHAGNWMWTHDSTDPYDQSSIVMIPIDHGLGMSFGADPDYGDLVDPMDYIFNDSAKAGFYNKLNIGNELSAVMGEELYTQMAKMSSQQAIQYLEALYPAGVNPSIDILVARLNQILNYGV